MSDNNELTVSVQAYIRSGAVQERLESMLKERAGAFTASLMSVVNSNPVLQECKPDSVVKAAITAAAMDLPINPNLGFAYIIPYKNKKTKLQEKYFDSKGVERSRDKWVDNGYSAQFQMGYKGFIQLAQRSGTYKTINVTDVRKGEFKGEDRLSGDLTFSWIKNEEKRLKLPTVGFVAHFTLQTGFQKSKYMTNEALTAHAKRFSQSFKLGYGMWVDDFDSMAAKTVLKLLISKYGPMSTEMQQAILADQAAVDEDEFKYVDNDKSKKEKKTKKADDVDQTPKESTEAEADQTPIEGEIVDDKPAK